MSYPVYSADDYFYKNGPNPRKYDFDKNKLRDAHLLCQQRTEIALKSEVDKVFVANIFNTYEELKPYLKLASKSIT